MRDSAPEKRLVPGRFRRIWGIAQTIADEPGLTRSQLAPRFNLSERQIQADLIIIRDQLQMPLVRQQGYRFIDDNGNTGAATLSFVDVLLLARVMIGARGDRSIPPAQLTVLTRKAALLAPPHLRHLAVRLIDPNTRGILAPLTDAIITGGTVLLTWQDGEYISQMGVTPELIFPYLGGWYVLGTTRDGNHTRDRMIRLDKVVRAVPAVIEETTRQTVRAAS